MLDAFLGLPCTGCSDAAGPVCPACAELLLGPPLRGHLGAARVPWATSAPYDDAVAALVVAYKDGGGWGLGGWLGTALARAVAALDGIDDPAVGPLLLVPVPQRPGRALRRGGDPVAAMTRQAARRLAGHGVAVADRRRSGHRGPVVRWVRSGPDQVGLTPGQREANVHAAMQAVPPPRDGRYRVVVTDDVLTTGATVLETVRALRDAGWGVAGVAGVARAGPSAADAAAR